MQEANPKALALVILVEVFDSNPATELNQVYKQTSQYGK